MVSQRKLATETVRTYGAKSELPTRAALIDEAQWSHGHVIWLRKVVQMIDQDALVWGVTEEHEKLASEFPGVDVKKMAAPNVWLKLYHDERKLLLEYAKTIETLKLQQEWAEVLKRMAGWNYKALGAVLDRRGIAVDDDLRVEFQAELDRISGVRTIEGRVA